MPGTPNSDNVSYSASDDDSVAAPHSSANTRATVSLPARVRPAIPMTIFLRNDFGKYILDLLVEMLNRIDVVVDHEVGAIA